MSSDNVNRAAAWMDAGEAEENAGSHWRSGGTVTTTPTLRELVMAELLARTVCDSQLKSCRENWPDHPASWCDGCLHAEAAAALASPESGRQDWLTRHVDLGHSLTKHSDHDECSCGAVYGVEQDLAARLHEAVTRYEALLRQMDELSRQWRQIVKNARTGVRTSTSGTRANAYEKCASDLDALRSSAAAPLKGTRDYETMRALLAAAFPNQPMLVALVNVLEERARYFAIVERMKERR